jgi:hypothetical protein
LDGHEDTKPEKILVLQNFVSSCLRGYLPRDSIARARLKGSRYRILSGDASERVQFDCHDAAKKFLSCKTSCLRVFVAIAPGDSIAGALA